MSRRGRSAVLAAIAIVAAMAVIAGAVGGASSEPPSSAGHPALAARGSAGGSAWGGHARRVGAVTRGRIGFALTLRLHEGRLNRYLSHVSLGRGRLSARQFGTRFGESAGQLTQLRMLLSDSGITITRLYPQRTAMLARADVTQLQRVFALRFGRYVTAAGQAYFAAERAPRIPTSLARYVSGLGDLSNAPVSADDIPASGLTPALTADAYDITPLWSRGDNGRGQTIAVATPGGAAPNTGVINLADLQAFAKLNAGSTPHVEIKQVDGGSAYSQQGGSDGETDLDLQVIGGVAPDARIIDYQGSSRPALGHSLADIYNQIEQDGQAKIVSTSYGVCEAALAAQDPGGQQLIDNSLKALDAAGVTVFVASGDTGAYACLQAVQIEPASTLPSAATGLAVQAPASSPYVVSVGGTRLELRTGGSYLAESAWSDPLERSGGGGGISADERRPVWQQGPGVIERGINAAGARQVPDVAGPSDPSSGFAICGTPGGESQPTCAPGNGGTSAAAPFWAASMLLVQQYAARHGAGRLASCFAAPILYVLAAAHQPVPPFHQVMFGNNGYYPARAGWNYATGLGSPDVFNLAQDYAAFLHRRSSRTCPF
ncbi:MAG: S53 family peptidase [Solirubrobacteraceae bacterium]